MAAKMKPTEPPERFDLAKVMAAAENRCSACDTPAARSEELAVEISLAVVGIGMVTPEDVWELMLVSFKHGMEYRTTEGG